MEGIEEVSIDLWGAYRSLAEELMPNATVVADRFHVMNIINGELDKKRKSEYREAQKLTNETEKERIIEGLKKSKYVLIKNEDNLKEEQKLKLEEVKTVSPQLSIMHQLKEEFRAIYETTENWYDGMSRITDWLAKAGEYFSESQKTIMRWLGEIISYFERRTSNGVVEGINNKLKLIKRAAYGFRNFHNFRIRCLLSWHFSG